jgi:hypothetical protein
VVISSNHVKGVNDQRSVFHDSNASVNDFGAGCRVKGLVYSPVVSGTKSIFWTSEIV